MLQLNLNKLDKICEATRKLPRHGGYAGSWFTSKQNFDLPPKTCVLQNQSLGGVSEFRIVNGELGWLVYQQKQATIEGQPLSYPGSRAFDEGKPSTSEGFPSLIWNGSAGEQIWVSEKLPEWSGPIEIFCQIVVWNDQLIPPTVDKINQLLDQWTREVLIKSSYLREASLWLYPISDGVSLLFSWKTDSLSRQVWRPPTHWEIRRMGNLDVSKIVEYIYQLVGILNDQTMSIQMINWDDAQEWINWMIGQPTAASDSRIENSLSSMVGGINPEIMQQLNQLCQIWALDGRIRHDLGLRMPRGILLHGPPGTGKTLLARYISQMIVGSKLQLVKGPEILSKWMGESESGVRAWFSGAYLDWKNLGYNSPLHIIVIDEIDALMRSREGAIGDTVVTQFLSLVDGIDSPPNFIVVGTTNHLERVDPAVRRPGRLEIAIKMNYITDPAAWKEICQIHLHKVWQSSSEWAAEQMFKSVQLESQNWTGADIEQLVQRQLLMALQKCGWKLPKDHQLLEVVKANWF